MSYDAQPTPVLLTAAEFSERVGGKVAPDDPRVQPLIDGATVAIRRHCGWHIAPVATEELLLDGEGGDLLVLPTLRLVSVDALSVRQAPFTYTEGTTPSWEDYTSPQLEWLEWSENGEVYHRKRWPHRFRSIRITIQHGFTSIAALEQIIQQLVANAIASPMGATSESAGALSVSWATTAPGVSGGISLLQRDLDLINTYRLPESA